MWGRGEGNFLKKVSLSPPPRPLLSPFQDFRLYRIPHPGLSSFVGTGLICLSARLVRLALVPPTAVNVTGISRARGIDARRAGARAMPNRTCSLEHPKDEHEKQRHSVRKRGKKRCRKSPRGHFFVFASSFRTYHDSFFTIKTHFDYIPCSFLQKIVLFQ